MFNFRKRLDLPTKAEALPGRDAPIPTAERHFVNGHPLKGPYPDGAEKAIFGLGCFWGAERKFWELGDGVYVTAVGYSGGVTPNPTYEEVCSGLTGHNEVVLVVFDPAKISYEALLRTFWESHDPTQGMRQGNDAGTQYRSGIYVFDEAQRKAAEASKKAYAEALEQARLWVDHDRDPGRRPLLLRRGLPSAISRQEPARLLRARRDGRGLPGRDRRVGGLRERLRRPMPPRVTGHP